MARYLDLTALPDHVARYAQGQVDAGRFATLEDVLSAGVEALEERDRADREWIAEARTEAEDGLAALDRGEGVHSTVDDLLERIDARVRGQAAERVGR
jgi:Arc/MetJ-type ribon-helix-helix transcriptional regulator